MTFPLILSAIIAYLALGVVVARLLQCVLDDEDPPIALAGLTVLMWPIVAVFAVGTGVLAVFAVGTGVLLALGALVRLRRGD